MSTSSQSTRLYTVEFLRIWFILCIIVFHVSKAVNPPTLQNDLMQFLHSSGLGLSKAVELFFVIGGFFLYRRLSQGTTDAFGMIKKTYFRLLPVTLFALTIVYAIGRIKMTYIPYSIAQLNGIGLYKGNVLGYGDWFIGVYFWTTCLFIGIFQARSKYRWLWLAILVYLCFILKFRNEFTSGQGIGAGQGLYYGVISIGLVQGIGCMGMGMASAFLAEKVSISFKWPIKFVFTVIKVACLVSIYNYLLNTKNSQMDYFGMVMVMSGFMISISHSWGYISSLLNKMSAIQYASRYTLPSLYGHIICFHILTRFQNFGLESYPRAIFIICGGIALGIFEYHVVEKWLTPKISTFFHA